MEDLLKQTLLYDLYSSLLTEKEKQCYEMHFLDDCSLFEISEELGVKRQSVYDNIKRCSKKLIFYEEKLHLLEKLEIIKEIEKENLNINNKKIANLIEIYKEV